MLGNWFGRFCGAAIVLALLLFSTPCSCSRGLEGPGSVTVPRGRFGPDRREERRLLMDSSTAPGLCESIIKAAGYPCEEITVPTSDGFLLGLQHIPHGVVGSSSTHKKLPVFLQHGLTQGGDIWALNPPKESLAYILADEGFDVWIGNLRGGRFSYGHKNLSPTDSRFWDWSVDELADTDLPALVGYVTSATQSQLYYVGHSQGTILALAAMSDDNSAVTNMLKAGVLFAPIAYMQHMRSPLLTLSADLMLDKIVGLFGTREFNLNNEVGSWLVNNDPNMICDNLLLDFSGPSCCINTSRVPYYLQWEPQSTSTKNLQHLAQMMRSGRFEKFDHGLFGNAAHYTRLSPPQYKLADIPRTMSLLMVSGGQDALADPIDVKRLAGELRCRVSSHYLSNYGHSDFVLGTQAQVDVYPQVINYLQTLEH